MKIRQTYLCGNDSICIRFSYNSIGLIEGMTEIDSNSDLDKDEFNVPKVEVTNEFFFKIINNKKLK